jgi:hypothetical protein
MRVGATTVGGWQSGRRPRMQARAHGGAPPGEGLADAPRGGPRGGGSRRAVAHQGARGGVRRRVPTMVRLGKAELWSHGVNDARSGPAPNWRSRCRAEVCFNDANCLVRPQHLLSRPPS